MGPALCHQINLRHVKSKCHYDAPSRHLPRCVMLAEPAQKSSDIVHSLPECAVMLDGQASTLHTYERKLYPHNKGEDATTK